MQPLDWEDSSLSLFYGEKGRDRRVLADWAAAGDTRPEPPWLDDRGSGYRLGLLWEAWGGGWCVSCQAVGHGGLPVGYNNEPETQTAYRRPARSRSKRIIGGEAGCRRRNLPESLALLRDGYFLCPAGPRIQRSGRGRVVQGRLIPAVSVQRGRHGADVHTPPGWPRGTMNSLLDTTVNLCTGQYAGVLLFARLWRHGWVFCCACAAAGGGTPAGEDI